MADLDQLIRIGKITSVDEKKHTARVQFTDRDKMVSWDLPVLVPSTVDPQDYGQQQGFVIGAFYTDANPPPITDRKKYLRKFKDGTEIEADKETGNVTVKTANHFRVNP